MDKKSIVIVVILGIILMGIITAVFLYDGKINTNIVEVNGVKYDKSDFESYVKVWQYENGSTAVDMNTMLSNYQVYKLYSQYVDKYHVELPSGESVAALTDAEIAKLSEDFALSESEYMRVKTEVAKVDHLYANLQEYWIVSDADYEEHKGENADKFKMYDYRVMQVAIEQPSETSGDVSGDSASGDNSEEDRKAAAMSKAVEALAKVKSGDSFEEVAKEYGTMRIAYTGSGYSIINGNIETVSGLYMEDYVWDANVIKALTTLNKGEYSEIYEDESGYTFVYLENIRDGLDETDENNYKRQIANEHIQGGATVVVNKITFKSVKLEEIIPGLDKITSESGDSAEEEHNHDHDHEDESGVEISISSGDEVSGEEVVE